MARTNCTNAQFAVVGMEQPNGEWGAGFGILYWHDNELDAQRDAKSVNQRGGDCHVVPAPKGELSDDDRQEVNNLVQDALI